MAEDVRRGFAPGDAAAFHGGALALLRRAQEDVVYLLNRGYGAQQAAAFVGNRFQLTARQRAALLRSACTDAQRAGRRAREIAGSLAGRTLTVDGFNLVITLEAALSGSTVLLCRDEALRDLCGLRGTYRLIGATVPALALLMEAVGETGAGCAVFVLDRPVSNSGRLAQSIREAAAGRPFAVETRVTPQADREVAAGGCAATSDSVILDRCGAWVNLAARALARVPGFSPVDLSGG